MTKKILLVEDNEINQKISSRFLEVAGIDVVIAKNGQEAVNKAAETSYDLILMDCHMPIMDGMEATQKIRELQKAGKSSPCKILAITAYDFEKDRQKYIDAGVDEIMSKLQFWNNTGDVLKKFLDLDI